MSGPEEFAAATPRPVRVPVELFRFTDGERAGLYWAILRAFSEANERLVTALNLDDLRARMRSLGWAHLLDDDDLAGALKQLRDWRLVDVSQNTSGDYRTAAEFERRNLQYSLTLHGEAAFAGATHALDVLTSTGALQTAVLDAICDRLGELHALLADPASPDRRVFSALSELENHLEALRTNTTTFNAELQRLVRAESADLATFHEVKSATVVYLQEFLTDLDLRVHRIRAAVDAVAGHGVSALHHRALLGADLPPSTGPERRSAWLDRRAARWEGLTTWFAPPPGLAPRAMDLHDVARRAIIALLQVLERLTEARRRASSATEDFRTLARWFATAPTEDDLHRLWSVAFGLTPARHAHLVEPDPDLVGPSTPWAQAPPVPVSPLLRTSARTERHARPARVRDVAAVREQRARQAAAERAAVQLAWDALATDGTITLSRISAEAHAVLDHSYLERLLELLGRALAAPPDATGTRRSSTIDGRVHITLAPAASGASVVLRTARGELTAPDYRVSIAPAGESGFSLATAREAAG